MFPSEHEVPYWATFLWFVLFKFRKFRSPFGPEVLHWAAFLCFVFRFRRFRFFFFSTIDYRFCNDYFVLCPRVFWARGSVVSRFLFLYLDFLDLGIYFFSTFVFRIEYFERCNCLFAATTQQAQRRRCPGSPGKWPLYYLTFEHGWSFNAELCDWAYWQSREHKSLSKCDWDGAVCASPRSVHLRLLSAQRCCCSSDARWEARALSYPAITREVPYARAPLC